MTATLRNLVTLSIIIRLLFTTQAMAETTAYDPLAISPPIKLDTVEILVSPANNYQQATGWGKDTTGGKGGKTYTVTHLNDAGEGSLRDALSKDEPLIIKFIRGLNGTILFKKPIRVASNKTIDARANNITLSPDNAASPKSGLIIKNASNIIIFNLTFDGRQENWNKDDEGSDGINISGDSRNIWIHKSTFLKWSDGAIDMRPNDNGIMPSRITVTSSKFSKTFQALNWTANEVSFGWNLCDEIMARCIKIISGKAHSFNNVIMNFGGREIQAAKSGGQLYSFGNIFISGNHGGDSINKLKYQGLIQMSNNEYQHKAFAKSNDKINTQFMKISNNITKTVQCKTKGCWKALEKLIVENSGVSD